MTKYIWCEDTGSGFQFWQAVFAVIDKEILVQSKGNNTRLRYSASKISDDGNQYFIIIDNDVDNADMLRELKRLKQETKAKNNVRMINIHSFEYVLLSFKKLEEWVFAAADELKIKREKLLEVRRIFIELLEHGGNASELSILKNNIDFPEKLNTEQLSAKLLYEITKNTGFETNKGHLGQCFVINCCDWAKRQDDDICGLDNRHMNAYAKICELIEFTVFKQSLQKVGL